MTQLWIPGPTQVRSEVLAECTRPMIGHRSAAMGELLARLDAPLHHAFGTWDGSSARAAVAPTSASGMLEGALLGAGEHVLSIVGGAFGKRWADIAELLGKRVRRLEVPWGEAVDDMQLADMLDQEGPFDAVTLVANETSTGVLTPIQHVSNVLQAFPDTLLLVDVVSLIGGGPIDFDTHCVDFALAGTQKALACPPGLAVFCVSEDYVERAGEGPRRSWYLDPLRILEGHEARSTPATPAIPLVYALARQLEDIDSGVMLPAADADARGAEAWAARYAKHERMRARTEAWAAGHGLEPLPPAGFRSPTVSCLKAGGVDVGALVAGLLERGFEIGGGYGPLKGETFRIGHMGDHTEEGLRELLAAADAVLAGD